MIDKTKLDMILSIFNKYIEGEKDFPLKQFLIFNRDNVVNLYNMNPTDNEVFEFITLIIFKLKANSPLQQELIKFLKENIKYE